MKTKTIERDAAGQCQSVEYDQREKNCPSRQGGGRDCPGKPIRWRQVGKCGPKPEINTKGLCGEIFRESEPATQEFRGQDSSRWQFKVTCTGGCIHIIEAEFGCGKVPQVNAPVSDTHLVKSSCEAKDRCSFVPDARFFGPRPRCKRNQLRARITYQCHNHRGNVRTNHLCDGGRRC